MKVISRHQSGLWENIDSPLFVANSKRMRAGECTLASRTECTNQVTNEVLKRDFDNEDWGVYHPQREGRPIDCCLEWDKEFWDLKDRSVLVLTDFRVTTTHGVHLLPSMMPWVLLESVLQPNWMLLFSVAHNNLDNTPERAEGWREEARFFRGWQHVKALGGAHRIHQADVNKNIREPVERSQVLTRMLEGTDLQWGWNTKRLPRNGTHGKQIIDYCFTDMESTSKVMRGDKFSDHNPIETVHHG